ncbi:MAG: hypothetical protein BWK73_18650 [Thiothrix lacustris]|uniref:Rpn family recombination-promoting nuclease/putative transposase n=1 Tax=Thiothrix lacustris TaxID=525917 RepID=A0A1Y1QQM9_9GAMM|nr:MAG: hypothetical protein BWK73_18650 [Thiothrix lacustris]
MQDKYVNPFTDFGFKKLFGEEPHKELLISFLNTLLPEKHQIQDLQYTRNEQQGASILDRKAIFDLSCTSLTGERFIVELQKANLTLPYFQKTLTELETDQDKWFYIFKHLHELQEIPPALQGRVFRKLFEAAQIACFNPAERQAYEDSLKYYRDLKNVTDTAWEEGREEGRKEGITIGIEQGKQEAQRKVILAMAAKGLDSAFIADTLNLSVEVV